MVWKKGTATRWYLKPGQTLENTKVVDRKHALVASSTAWKKIIGRLDEKRLEQEAKDVENAKKQEHKEKNDELVKSFNIQISHVEELTPQQRLKEEAERYFLIRKDQEKEREKYVQEVRKKMFMKGGEVKNLDSALLQSEILYERAQQKQYNEYFSEYEKTENEKYMAIDKEKYDQELQKELEKCKQKIDKSAQHQKDILAQIKENLEKRRAEKAEEFIKGCEDNRNMERHMKEIDVIERREKELAKEKIRQQCAEAKARKEAEKLQKIKENEEIDQIYSIYASAKCRIDSLRTEKVKEMLAQEIARRDVVRNKISTAAAEREAEEQRVLEKCLKEQELRELERLRLEKEKRLKAKREREENLKEMREKIARQKYKENETEKWEMLNRIKQQEATKQYEEERIKALHEKQKEYDMALLKQIQEHSEDEQKEKEKDVENAIFEQKKLEKIDEMFLIYGEQVLKEAKDRGRSTYPIEKVIAKYKKEHKVGDPVPKWQCTHYLNSNRCPEVKIAEQSKAQFMKPAIRRKDLKRGSSSIAPDKHYCEFCVV